MTKVKVSGTIPGPVAEVWALAGDFGGIAEWLPALAGSNLRSRIDWESSWRCATVHHRRRANPD